MRAAIFLALTAIVTFAALNASTAAADPVIEITVAEQCGADGTQLYLYWGYPIPYGGDTYVDAGFTPDWSRGAYVTYGPIPSTAGGTILGGLRPSTTYYARVYHQWPDGQWIPLEELEYRTSAACA